MPKQVMHVNNEQVNFVTAYGNGKFYIVFLNQSDDEIDFTAKVNPVLVPLDATKNYNARVWKQNENAKNEVLKNGEINLHIKPKGITAIAIDDISIVPQFQQSSDHPKAGNTYKLLDTEVGRINATVIAYGKYSNAFIWLTANGEKVKNVTFNYKLKTAKSWKKIVDDTYPFELSVPLENNTDQIECNISALLLDGKTVNIENVKLNN
jgi:hypothetical protein